MSWFEEHTAYSFEDLEYLAEQITGDRNLFINIDDRVWDIARESKDIPLFSNIYMSIVCNDFETILQEHYADLDLDICYYVNAEATSFCVNGEEIINNKDIFWDIIEKAELLKDTEAIEEMLSEFQTKHTTEEATDKAISSVLEAIDSEVNNKINKQRR